MKLGTNDITLKLGSINVDAAYLGTELVYSGETPFNGKFKAKYSSGPDYTLDCDETTTLSTGNTKPSGYSYSAMTEAVIGDCVTSTDFRAFDDCSSLTSITVPNSVTSFGRYTFRNCTSLTSIEIPSGVTAFSMGLFQNCSSLATIEIPSGVKMIDSETFQNCSSLTSVTVNATRPPTLGVNAFDSTNNYPIYVPSESVDTYKAANNWSTYASRIQAIPSLQWVEFSSADTIPQGNVYGIRLWAIPNDGSDVVIGSDSDNCAWFGLVEPTRAPARDTYFYTIDNGVSTLQYTWQNTYEEFIFSDYGTSYYYEDGTKSPPYTVMLYIYA